MDKDIPRADKTHVKLAANNRLRASTRRNAISLSPGDKWFARFAARSIGRDNETRRERESIN